APSKTASLCLASAKVSFGNGTPTLSIACPPISAATNSNECPYFSAMIFKTFTASGTISRPTPSPANTAILAFTVTPSDDSIGSWPIPISFHLPSARQDQRDTKTRHRFPRYFRGTVVLRAAHKQSFRLLST